MGAFSVEDDSGLVACGGAEVCDFFDECFACGFEVLVDEGFEECGLVDDVVSIYVVMVWHARCSLGIGLGDGGLGLSGVVSVYAGSYACEDFVGDCFGGFGEFIDGNGFFTVVADDGGGIAGADFWDVGYVDDDLVHADASSGGASCSVEEDLGSVGEAVGVSVGVSDGEYCDACLGGGGVGAAVSDGGTGIECSDLGDGGFPSENRFEVLVLGVVFEGGDTVGE